MNINFLIKLDLSSNSLLRLSGFKCFDYTDTDFRPLVTCVKPQFFWKPTLLFKFECLYDVLHMFLEDLGRGSRKGPQLYEVDTRS